VLPGTVRHVALSARASALGTRGAAPVLWPTLECTGGPSKLAARRRRAGRAAPPASRQAPRRLRETRSDDPSWRWRLPSGRDAAARAQTRAPPRPRTSDRSCARSGARRQGHGGAGQTAALLWCPAAHQRELCSPPTSSRGTSRRSLQRGSSTALAGTHAVDQRRPVLRASASVPDSNSTPAAQRCEPAVGLRIGRSSAPSMSCLMARGLSQAREGEGDGGSRAALRRSVKAQRRAGTDRGRRVAWRCSAGKLSRASRVQRRAVCAAACRARKVWAPRTMPPVSRGSHLLPSGRGPAIHGAAQKPACGNCLRCGDDDDASALRCV
jgi:hypothetical protein